MAEQNFPVLRASDKRILNFFEVLRTKYQFQQYQIAIFGFDGTLNPESPQVQLLEKQNKYTIRSVSISRNQGGVSYTRHVDQNKFSTPDVIKLHNNNNSLTFEEVLSINELISSTFKTEASSAIPSDQSALTEAIASHQQIVTRLEESLERISERFAQERLKVQSEQDDFIRKKQDEFSQRESQLRDEVSQERQQLVAREKDLDDRTNMHARRGIREDMKKRLQEHAVKFTLTDKTRQLRLPIHCAVLFTLAVLIWTIVHYTRQYDDLISAAIKPIIDPVFATKISMPTSFLYPLLAKISLLSIAVIGILTWYIRWMNRWFQQHAEAEFNLKQFELDVDRASWVVETAMEWRSSAHGVIPSRLLESISRNLFAFREQKRDEDMHPADYLASAIFGSAAKAKLKVGDHEIELDRKSVKNLTKDQER